MDVGILLIIKVKDMYIDGDLEGIWEKSRPVQFCGQKAHFSQEKQLKVDTSKQGSRKVKVIKSNDQIHLRPYSR